MTVPKTFKLNTGADIPTIGLGTWQSSPGKVATAVEQALKFGYRHIDAAFCYQNEDEVGRGLQTAFRSGIKREDVFITSKLWNTYHRKVEEGLNASLKALRVDYLDLYLMHWPVPMNPAGNHPLFPTREDGSRDLDSQWSFVETWKELEKLIKTGKVKAIGVSNCSVKYLKELLLHADITPAVNQIENHPYLPQGDVVDYCQHKGILVEAYSPFGSSGSPLFSEKAVKQVAEKHHVGPGTVLVSYQVNRGIIPLPKFENAERIEQNLVAISLQPADMDLLDKVHQTQGLKRFVYPPFGVSLGFPDKPL